MKPRPAQAEYAQAIRREWCAAHKDFVDLDAGLSFAVGATGRLYDRYERMQQHGLKPPPQLTLMLADVVVAALVAMPKPLWLQFNYQGIEHLSPGKRCNAASLADAWGPQTAHKPRSSAVNTINRRPHEPTRPMARVRARVAARSARRRLLCPHLQGR